MEEHNKDINLLQHRENLSNNPNRFIHDKERAIKRFAETSYKNYGRCGKKKKISNAIT